MKATAGGQPKLTEAKSRGLTKRELARMKRTWATSARCLIKALPVPTHATMRDMVAVFDAVLTEVGKGRKIVRALARPAKKAVA
jgi:hypothetical protein